jgi:hypothetical protein
MFGQFGLVLARRTLGSEPDNDSFDQLPGL